MNFHSSSLGFPGSSDPATPTAAALPLCSQQEQAARESKRAFKKDGVRQQGQRYQSLVK